MTLDEYTAIGQAIVIMSQPTMKWSKEHRQEVSEKLLEIMGKYMPKGENYDK